MRISIEDSSTNDLSSRTIRHSAQHFVLKTMPLHNFSGILIAQISVTYRLRHCHAKNTTARVSGERVFHNVV
ncbi:hypothetical protein CWO90_02210 [Bradyrhizobium sp. Leo121]|nr:hypothetical protein CWO90_02210 [Bradyrhizobium sp. Leo121]